MFKLFSTFNAVYLLVYSNQTRKYNFKLHTVVCILWIFKAFKLSTFMTNYAASTEPLISNICYQFHRIYDLTIDYSKLRLYLNIHGHPSLLLHYLEYPEDKHSCENHT